MWCKNLGMCIDRNAYLASFPFGQCMDWTTHAEQCPEASVENATSSDFENVCLGYQTCDSCRGNPSCGWCDNGKGTYIYKIKWDFLKNFHMYFLFYQVLE